jgi:hypothetical protein
MDIILENIQNEYDEDDNEKTEERTMNGFCTLFK